MAALLRDKLGDQANKVPKRALPDFVLRLIGLFDSELRSIIPMLGRKFRHSAGWQSRSTEATVIDCAKSLLQRGVV
ncbi:hypothetical protein [Paenibacillus silvisoli]|uniref:hypothetical protein n=1 Tax=Paenibacillus silvisoli TaxID=3110539 RepID=UPI0028038D1E|nr:hypothetical protein [Paenibacillus silvisoli]